MTANFDQKFPEITTKMVEASFEYVHHNSEEVEQIFLFCSMEDNEYYFNVFYKINGEISFMHEIDQHSKMPCDISDERMFGLLDLGLAYLLEMKEIFETNQREVPTLIKLVFYPKTGNLESDFSYELQFSHDAEKISDDCFTEWAETEQSKNR